MTQTFAPSCRCRTSAEAKTDMPLPEIVNEIRNKAIDDAVQTLNDDITTVALKTQRVDDRVTELEDVCQTQGELLLLALRRITVLEKQSRKRHCG